MRRVSVALTQRSYDFLRREARRHRISMAALIRAMIEDRMRARRRITAGHPFRDIIGIGRGDGSPVSENHDRYLYGWRARNR
jgi:hypothetical protein